MAQWKIGCSGYYYGEWKSLFYPENLPKTKWFEYYAQLFNTIELNVTFYRFPRVEFLNNWYNRCPENFIFSVKAPRLITHYKRFKDAQKLLSNFYSSVKQGLREKLGCVLFQFPSTFAFEDDRLERIVNLLDKSIVNVAEFRHPSWWQDKVYLALKANNITFCSMSHPGLPEQLIKTTDSVYYRFHGVPHLYVSPYETQKLEQIAGEIQQSDPLKEAYLYFNNTTEGAAIKNAKQLQEICELVH